MTEYKHQVGIKFGDYLQGQVETLGSVFTYYYEIPKMRHENVNGT